MFMWKCIVLCALVAAPALGSGVKGGRLQTEQLQLSKSQKLEKTEQVTEQREEPLAQQLVEQEPVSQVKEEAPRQEETKRYEARPQVAREELAKGQIKYEQRAEEKIEQLPQQRVEYESQQQVELKESGEQRRLEEAAGEPAPFEQQREQGYKSYQQRAQGAEKGLVAPAGQAEPYAFSYQVEGSSRSESSDANGVVRGQYTIQGADGPSRVVDYIADHNGFRASVNTNEFGTESKSAANVVLRTSQPNAEDITLRLEGKTKLELAAPAGAVKGAPLAQRYESVKGAAPLPLPLPLPVQAPIRQEESKAAKSSEEYRAPAKGQRFAAKEQQEEAEPLAAELPTKSAPLRSPKTLSYVSSEPRVFESATAHRNYRGPIVVAPRPVVAGPAVVVRREPAGVLRAPVSRGQLHRQYPPSPVLGYRRQQVEPVVAAAVGPRPGVSFYGSGFEDELPVFDHPEVSI